MNAVLKIQVDKKWAHVHNCFSLQFSLFPISAYQSRLFLSLFLSMFALFTGLQPSEFISGSTQFIHF